MADAAADLTMKKKKRLVACGVLGSLKMHMTVNQ
jgi:hypothetical protein